MFRDSLYRSLALSLLMLVASCNEDPDICIERKPVPVVYCVINKYDSVHYTYITKTWSGDNGGTLATAANPDSIYFRDVQVRQELVFRNQQYFPPRRDTLRMNLVPEIIPNKQPGLFSFPECPVFALHQPLQDFDRVISRIFIPGYEEIVLEFNLQEQPKIIYPTRDGSTIAIYPDKGLKISFQGGSLNEARFFFEIIEKSSEGLTTDTVLIKKYLENGVTTFTYDYLQSALMQQLTYRTDIEYRRLGKVDLEVTSGYGNFPMWIDRREISYINNDYTTINSPDIPALFFFGGSIAITWKRNLDLDYQTHEAIANDPELARFRFLRW